MHSFLDFANPQLRSIVWVQYVGMPLAFIVRAAVLIVRAFREPAENRRKHTIRAVSNVLFATSCWTFAVSRPIAASCFVTGIGLAVWAFTIAREQAIRNAPPRPLSPKTPGTPISIRNTRLAGARRRSAGTTAFGGQRR